MSLQFKFSVHPCDVCIILVFPPHLFAYLLTFLLQVKFASNNSRQLDFPRRFELSGVDCMSLLFNGFFNSTRCRCLGLIAVSIYVYIVLHYISDYIHIWETSNHNHAQNMWLLFCSDSFYAQTHTYQGPHNVATNIASSKYSRHSCGACKIHYRLRDKYSLSKRLPNDLRHWRFKIG